MNAFAFWNSSDQILMWGVNVLLQVTLVTAVALAMAAYLRRSPAVRYWVLCSALLLVLFSPVIAIVMQLSERSVLSVSLMHEAKASVSGVTVSELSVGPQILEASSLPAPTEDFDNSPNLAQGFLADAGNPFDADYPGRTDDRRAEPGAATEVTSASPPPKPTVAQEDALAASLAPQQTATWIGKTFRVLIPPLLFAWLTGAVFLLVRLAIG
jgi:hypothetical protein